MSNEADRMISRLMAPDVSPADLTAASALIAKMVAENAGPGEFDTWKEAAIAERVLRINAERQVDTLTAAAKMGDGFATILKNADRYSYLRNHCYKHKYPNSEWDNAMQVQFTVSGIWLGNHDPRVLDGCVDTAIQLKDERGIEPDSWGGTLSKPKAPQ